MFPLVNKLQRSYFLPFTTPLSLYRERKDLQKFYSKKKKKKLEEDFLKLINSSTRFDYFDSLAKIPRLYFVQSNARNALRDKKKRNPLWEEDRIFPFRQEFVYIESNC